MGQTKSKASSIKCNDKIIAAIDFGTTYTGFAYCFSADEKTIFTASHGNILSDERVPTSLLLEQDGSFNSFGLVAEERYAKFAFKGCHDKYRLFERFKMSLYSKEKLEGNMTIEDTTKHSMTALSVFSIVIRHLKGLIIKSMKGSKTGNTDSFESKILWMLTIPAIWSDSARQFMRRAAIDGGIPEKQLRLVLEPEAAAVFCKDILLNVVNRASLTKLPPGTKYILADLGGGTADICAHEILDQGKICELYRATGGAFGGEKVNDRYVEFLKDIFGSDDWENFKKTKMYDYLVCMRSFEEIKKKWDDDDLGTVIIDIPQSLVIKLPGEDLARAVRKSEYSDLINVKENKIICEKELIQLFFKTSVYDGIIPKLKEVVEACRGDKIDILLIVGGFAESQYVRKLIEKEISKMRVVLAQQPRLAILKGAVMMGSLPENVIERRSRFTYGFAVAVPFVYGKHPEALKFEREGNTFCNLIFEKLFEKDSVLQYGDTFRVTTNTRRLETKHEDSSVLLCRSNRRNPKYCLDSEDCIEIGNIVIQPPAEGWNNNVELIMLLIVGETEFRVKAIDSSTGREFEASVDFL